jgi:hypothetical protein
MLSSHEYGNIYSSATQLPIHQIAWWHNTKQKNKQIKMNKSAQNWFFPDQLATVNAVFIFNAAIFKQYIPKK